MNIDINQPIQWSEKYTIGIPLIDSQHQRLIEMAENLRMTIRAEGNNPPGPGTVANTNSVAITKVLKGLINYCSDHFECEQMLMETVHFPAFNGHLALHRKFTETTLQWFYDYQSGNLDPMVVLEALMQWLIDHILSRDVKIVEHCYKRSIDCSKFISVSDVIPTDEPSFRWKLPIEAGMSLFMIPMFGLWTWLTIYFIGLVSSLAIPCLVIGVNLILSIAMMMYVRKAVLLRTQSLHLAHARQLADNMLAGEIAQRISVMDLENINSVLQDESSPLVAALQDIVDNLRVYLPFIPETILAMAHGQVDESEEKEKKKTLVPPLDKNNFLWVPHGAQAYQVHSHRSGNKSDRSFVRNISANTLASKIFKSNSRKSMDSYVSAAAAAAARRMSCKSGGTNVSRMPSARYNLPSDGSMPMSDDESPRSSGWKRTLLPSFLHDNSITPSSPRSLLNIPNMAVVPQQAQLFESTAMAMGMGDGNHTFSGDGGVIILKRTTGQQRRASKGNNIGTPSCKSPISASSGAPSIGITPAASRVKNLQTTWLTKKSVSVMVTDISGFNNLVQALPMEAFLRLHGEYVNLVETVAKSTKGNINSLLGDKMLISWNAANACGEYAQQACKAALLLQESMKQEPIFEETKCKMAISSGVALVGNIGSKSLLNFAIIGPMFHVASALCKLNAVLQTEILICSNTWRNTKEFYISKIVAQYDFLCSIGPDEGGSIYGDLETMRDEHSATTTATNAPPIVVESGCSSNSGDGTTPRNTNEMVRNDLENTESGEDPTKKTIVGNAPFSSRGGLPATASVVRFACDSIPSQLPPIPTVRLSTMPSFLLLSKTSSCVEFRRMYALELIDALTGSGADGETSLNEEWMYALQNARNPLAQYNQSVLEIFYGNAEKGKDGLKAHLQANPNDKIGHDILQWSETDQNNSFATPSFAWVYGWNHP